MLILDNGAYYGGISGGCLEGDALRKAQKAIHLNKPSTVIYDTTQDDEHQIGVGLGCNGIIEVLFTPLDPNDQANPIFILSKILETREPRVVVTILESDEHLQGKMFLFENDAHFLSSFPVKEIAFELLTDLKLSLAGNRSQITCYGPYRLFIEIIPPVLHLMIFGSNYDVYPLLRISGELGWTTTVITRLSRATKLLTETASRVLNHDKDATPLIDPYTAILLMSHDYLTDLNNLQTILKTSVRYIGILGPKKRTIKIFDALRQNGVEINEQVKEKIFSPAGLEIGASSPEEIALSIAAEIQGCFSGTEGKSLRLKEGRIHDN